MHETTNNLIPKMQQFSFHQLVTEATTDYGSLLDHVYSNCFGWEIHIEVIDCYFTDHDCHCVYVSLPLKQNPCQWQFKMAFQLQVNLQRGSHLCHVCCVGVDIVAAVEIGTTP